MMNKIFLLFTLVTFTVSTQVSGKDLVGRVSDVPNGDTIIVTDAQNQQHKVYLLGIAAPKMKQAFGKESRSYLERLLFARNDQVKIVIKKRTPANNLVGTVYAAEMNSSQFADINGMMVMAGFAWANPRTSKQYIAIEKIARNRKAGLWKQKKPVAPWKWRRK